MIRLFVTLFISTIIIADLITPIKEIENYNKKKVALGKKIFFDKSFSLDKSISCASCHSEFGSDKRDVSLGIDGKKGNIQSLSVFNAVNNYKFFWNGRAESLFEQIDGPVHAGFEMGTSIEGIEGYLNSSKEYIKSFNEVYKSKPSYELFKDAIVEFEKTLLTPNSRFDRYLNGEDTLSSTEKKGYEAFKSLGCISCHNGVNIGGNSMQMIGSVIEYPYVEGQNDLYSTTKLESDKNVFRVPTLRNISKTAPYYHDASAKTLEEAVIKMSYHNLGILIKKEDINLLVAFLKSLDGDIPKTWVNDVK